MARLNIHSEIGKNKRNSGLIVFFFVVLIAVMGYVLGFFFGSPSFGIFLAVFISIIYFFIGYYAGHSMVLGSVGAKEVTANTQDLKLKQYYNTVEEVVISAGIPMPKVWIIPSQAMNAFATGRDPKNGHVAMTQGLLDKLNREETKAVVAHEVAHIKNYDIRLLLITAILIGVIIMLAEILIRGAIFGGGGGRGSGQAKLAMLGIGIIFAILAPVFAQIARFALSRQREYLADTTAVQLTRYPEGLASALEKIANDKTDLRGASSMNSEMFIKDPVKKNFFHSLFSTHPPIEERIRRLRNI
ncbi:MAG: M48 family metallopeptidase [Candidatus Woesearchaeota archaeon]